MQEVKLHFQKKNDFRMKEAFKTLRSNIEFCGDDVKVIAVTSCMAHEGKSSVAMELAKSFAEAGNMTLLIDADMRKSVLIGRYKTGAVKYGLSHCLIGKHKYMDVICETDIPRLYMLFAGPVPPNPSELLGSGKFTEMLGVMRRPFTYIIIDTPPLGSVIDAAVVAKNCDGTVLVVENNAISYRFAQRVKEQLDKTGSRILGAVLNKVDLTGKGYYGYYGKYYGKYYGNYYGNYSDPKLKEQQEKEEKQIIELQKEFHEQQRRTDRERIDWDEKEKKEKKRKSTRKTVKWVVVALSIIVFVLLLVFGGYQTLRAVGKRRLQNQADSTHPELQAAIGTDKLAFEEELIWQDGWVKYNDTIYRYNEELLTFLIMGIDKNSDAKEVAEGTDGGQADAIFLAVMNPEEKSVKMIAVNRNAMTDIDVYDETGSYVATVKAQLAVQHGFGNGVEESCEYQKKAVQKLFYNLPIHGYVAINMSAIPTINDAVGGIDVTVLEDLTKADTSLVKDAKVHLSGRTAFLYVQYRDIDIFGSADARLMRQKQYLSGLIDTSRQVMKKDISIALSLYNAVSPQMITDISADKAVYLASILPDYKFDEDSFYSIEGKTVKGEEFEEFYPDENAFYELILDVFYEEVDEEIYTQTEVGV